MTTFQVTAHGRVATEIFVGPGVSEGPILPERQDRRKTVFLAQPGVPLALAQRLSGRLGGAGTTFEIPDRDEAKRWEVVAQIQADMADLAMGRHDTVVGVGGGAATDLAGFVAATWMRGIEAVYVPTTLLGAVDAAVGGKTGINLGGKNLVGAFAHPSRVIVDTDLLDQLPLAIKREGWAEAVKTGFIADPQLVRIFEESPGNPPTAEIVERSIGVKSQVVSEDFTETGRRMILNFGHTIGHGVEFAQRLSHGEAVSIGMVAAAAISKERYGFDYPMARTLESLGLPTAASADRAAVERLIWLDKKRDAQGIKMILVSGIGQPHIDYVTADEMAVGLAAIGLP